MISVKLPGHQHWTVGLWRHFRRSPSAMVGLTLLLLHLTVAVTAP